MQRHMTSNLVATYNEIMTINSRVAEATVYYYSGHYLIVHHRTKSYLIIYDKITLNDSMYYVLIGISDGTHNLILYLSAPWAKISRRNHFINWNRIWRPFEICQSWIQDWITITVFGTVTNAIRPLAIPSSIFIGDKRRLAMSPPRGSRDVHWLENFNNPSDDRLEKYACPSECVTGATRTRGDTLNLRVPPCPPTPFPSARYSCLLIGRTRLELCRACADRFKEAKGSESTSRGCTLQSRYALENIQDYRTSYYHDKWFLLMRWCC